LKLLAGFTRKKASTCRVNRKIADSTRNQRVFFSRYLAATYDSPETKAPRSGCGLTLTLPTGIRGNTREALQNKKIIHEELGLKVPCSFGSAPVVGVVAVLYSLKLK